MRVSRGCATTLAVALLLACGTSDAIQVTPPVPTSVVPTAASMQLDVGETGQLGAAVLDQNGVPIASATVTWTSDAPQVATVTAGGLVEGIGAGATTVRAHSGVLEAPVAVTVVAVPVATLAQVVISPSSASLQTGATRQFSASGVLSDGNPTPVSVTYSSTGGTVSAGGLYTAGSAPGTFRVIATEPVSSLADTAAITVTFVPPPTLVQVILSPGSASLLPAQTRQFTASGVLSNGNPTTVSVNYGATGGTVTTGGLYTAGGTIGTFRVIATEPTSSLADTATITISPVPPTLAQVIISPSSASLQTGATQQFSASGVLSNGNPTTVSVNYGATGGSVTAGGLYTAGGAAGTFRVIATEPGSSLADTAVITLTAPPPTLAQVIIAPSSATVQTGATQQFSASGVLSNGNPTTVSVNYSATGGTVSAGGLYTAGGVAGTFRVIATEPGSSLADTAAITVTAAPGGFNTIWQLASFTGQNLNTIFQDRSGNDGTQAIVNGWLRQTIPSGASGGWADIHLNGAGGRPSEISSGTVRWSARVRLSANWGGKGRLLRIEGTPPGDYYAVAGVAGTCPAAGNGGNPLRQFFIARSSFAEFITGFPLRYYDQFVSQLGTILGNCFGVTGEGGGFGTATFPGGNFLPVGGADFVLTEEVMLNTPGLQNGRHRIYINGVLRAEFANLNLRTVGSNVVISVVGFEPYISSGGNPVGSPVYIEFSELLLQHDPTAVP